MKTKAVLILAFALFATAAFAAPGKPVSYKSGDDTVQGMLYQPEGDDSFPAIVVIHEWWGLNGWVKEQASKLADQGYVTLAVDLYRGKVAENSDMAHELARGLPEDRAGRDLRAAVAFLRSQPNVKKDHVGSIGWCMGGGYSLQTALEVPDLAATVTNYGHLVTEPESLDKIHAPHPRHFWRQGSGHHSGRRRQVRIRPEKTREKNRCEDLSRSRARLRKSQQ